MRRQGVDFSCLVVMAVPLVLGCGLLALWNGTAAEIERCCPLVQPAQPGLLAHPMHSFLLPGAGLAVVLALVILWSQARERAKARREGHLPPKQLRLWEIILGSAVVSALFCWPAFSLAKIANVRLDRGAAAQRSARVLERGSERARYTTSYLLTLSSWRADYGERVVVRVPKELHGSAPPGAAVRLETRPGFLGAEWVERAGLDQ